MRRRALLATVPTVLAGCIASPPANTATTTTSTTRTTDPDTRFAITDFHTETEKVAPDYRYLVRITKVYSEDAVTDEPGDQTVVDVADIEDTDVRTVIEDTLSNGKVHRDSIPDGLREIAERVDFFTWEETTSPDDTYSHWTIEVFEANQDRDPVLQFDVELSDGAVSPGDPGAITFTIENVGTEPREVFSGTVPPFGIVWADGPSDDRYLLWRDYEDEGCVNFTDDGKVVVCDIGKETRIDPGQSVERTYELRPENPVGAPLAAGEYVITGTLNYHERLQGPRTDVEWRVTYTVDEP